MSEPRERTAIARTSRWQQKRLGRQRPPLPVGPELTEKLGAQPLQHRRLLATPPSRQQTIALWARGHCLGTLRGVGGRATGLEAWQTLGLKRWPWASPTLARTSHAGGINIAISPDAAILTFATSANYERCCGARLLHRNLTQFGPSPAEIGRCWPIWPKSAESWPHILQNAYEIMYSDPHSHNDDAAPYHGPNGSVCVHVCSCGFGPLLLGAPRAATFWCQLGLSACARASGSLFVGLGGSRP